MSNNTPKLRFKEFTDEWQEKKLGEILKIGSGRDYKHLDNGDIPVYGTGGLMLKVNKYLYDGDSICIGRKGTIDKPQFLKDKFWTVDTLFYTYGFKDSLPKFLFPVFQKINWQKYNEASGVPSLSKTTIEKIKIFIPSEPEQQKIADFLGAIDEKIEKLEAKKKAFEKYKKGIMQAIFSQKIRFKKPDGSNFPDWEEKKLGEILKERKTYSSKSTGYEHISLTTAGVVPKSERYERDFLVRSSDKNYKITKIDDICYNPANLKFGVIARNKYKLGIFSPIYITFEVSNSDVGFVELMVTRKDFIQKARRYEQGTVYERMAVSSEDLLKVVVQVPCIEEQEKIAVFLTALDNKINFINNQLEQTKLFKKSLLQRMFV